ncbi:hypothetical protein QVD17_04366 [Tagetes erecta]|uniref:Uncharacterized protein n=1 Tax=Tagetes erecta TaxID=13708 RepID=A0AAD8PAP0_TARER|nr:hypothetical protein QVD17_04366 [Tagetes erecta]
MRSIRVRLTGFLRLCRLKRLGIEVNPLFTEFIKSKRIQSPSLLSTQLSLSPSSSSLPYSVASKLHSFAEPTNSDEFG